MSKNQKIVKKDRLSAREDLKLRIIQETIHLLEKGGREAVTLRSVCDAANIQAPTLYRIFQDMRGLLDAVTEFGILRALHSKSARKPTDDAVNDLKADFLAHVQFGLDNPAIYSLVFGELRPESVSSAREEANRLLAHLIHRIAKEGRLRVSESRAFQLVYANGTGVVLSLLNTPPALRSTDLPKDSLDSVLAAIIIQKAAPKKSSLQSAAVTLRACVSELEPLSSGEQHLLRELLDRISNFGL